MAASDTPIGELRWLVTLATRAQSAQPDGTGINEDWIHLVQVHARIQAMRPVTYWTAMQTETPVSHVIRIRWVNVLSNTQAILRTTIMQSGEPRTEVYRVRRYMEVEGRKRFVDIEAQQEVATQ